MKQIAWLICLGLVLGHLFGRVEAQDATPTPIFVEQPKPAPISPPPYEQIEGQRLIQVAFGFNICPEEIIAANRDVIPLESIFEYGTGSPLKPDVNIPLPANLTIPPHKDCYTILSPAGIWNYAQIERDYNVCLEEFAYLSQRYREGDNEYDAVFLRKDALPCVNDTGQRLKYFDSYGKLLDVPVYSDLPFIDDYDLSKPGYCPGDMVQINPQFSLNTENPYASMIYSSEFEMRVFVPPGARHCERLYVEEDIGSLYDLSQTVNVCMEDILEASGRFLTRIKGFMSYIIYVPVDVPPCYDEHGKRLGHNDFGLYEPQEGESFLGIAQDHDVCFDDLWEANPVMSTWNGSSGLLPEVVFLPSTPACKSTNATLTVRPNQTLHGLSLLTNVCVNRLIEANPWLQKLDPDLSAVLPAGETVIIPERPNCYYLTYSPILMDLKMIPYACYAVPVTDASDFTGHEPIITASNTDLPYCYERKDGMTIIYQNEPYTLYRIRGYESYTLISQCFDIPIDALQNVNMEDDPWTTYHNTTIFWGGLLIPQPHADCVFNTLDGYPHYEQFMTMTSNAGSLQEGVYIVNYQDTLSSIGRKYGYPYQWIANANNISAPYTIYYLQQLKMPSMPSLYTLVPLGGATGVTLLVSIAIYGLRRWSRSRDK